MQGALLVVLLGAIFGGLNVAAETAAFAAGQHLEAKGVVRRLAPFRPMLQQRHQSNFFTYAVPCTLGFAGGGWRATPACRTIFKAEHDFMLLQLPGRGLS